MHDITGTQKINGLFMVVSCFLPHHIMYGEAINYMYNCQNCITQIIRIWMIWPQCDTHKFNLQKNGHTKRKLTTTSVDFVGFLRFTRW